VTTQSTEQSRTRFFYVVVVVVIDR